MATRGEQVAWEVTYYETADGECPVRGFLDSLPKAHRAKVFATISRLRDQGPALGFPHTSQVSGKIREIRTHFGRHLYRLLYFMDRQRRAVLLDAFEKKSAKVPSERVAAALSRVEDHQEREG
jgi:phage-related protein